MLRDADEIREALASAGWTVSSLREKALILEERVCDVTNVTARREELRAFIVVARDCDEGDAVDRFASPAPSPTLAARRVGRTKVFVCVEDYARARTELEALLPTLEHDTRAWVDTLVARGWRVVRESSLATVEWDGSWQLLAERLGETLRVGVISRSGRDEGIRESNGSAFAAVGAYAVFVTVTSAAEASGLASTLTPGPT